MTLRNLEKISSYILDVCLFVWMLVCWSSWNVYNRNLGTTAYSPFESRHGIPAMGWLNVECWAEIGIKYIIIIFIVFLNSFRRIHRTTHVRLNQISKYSDYICDLNFEIISRIDYKRDASEAATSLSQKRNKMNCGKTTLVLIAITLLGIGIFWHLELTASVKTKPTSIAKELCHTRE